MMQRRHLCVALTLLMATAPLLAGGVSRSKTAAIATSSRHATAAGLSLLAEGGNAVDAAVAAAFMLAVTHPHATGLGGGGFLLYFDAASGVVWCLDFREAAGYKPGSATEPRTGAASAAVPGFVAGLGEAHRMFGSRTWNELLLPAIQAAESGIEPDNDLQRAAAAYGANAPIILKGGKLEQQQLAKTLGRLAARGARDFYDGSIAATLLTALRRSGSDLARRDFEEYRPLWRSPLQIEHAGNSIFTAPPPSRGGAAIAATIAILAADGSRALDPTDSGKLHRYVEASRRASIAVTAAVGDPSYSRVRYEEILSAERARSWRDSIDPERATPTAAVQRAMLSTDHTTAITVVDASGNAVAAVTSLGGDFGSGWVAGDSGVIMNGALNAFAPPSGDGTPRPNAAGPKKRMATPVTPLLVLGGGRLRLVAGATGGESIAPNLVTLLGRCVVGDQRLEDAIAAKRIYLNPASDHVDYEPAWEKATILELNAMGHGTMVRETIGEINAIIVGSDGMTAVADPRGTGASGGF